MQDQTPNQMLLFTKDPVSNLQMQFITKFPIFDDYLINQLILNVKTQNDKDQLRNRLLKLRNICQTQNPSLSVVDQQQFFQELKCAVSGGDWNSLQQYQEIDRSTKINTMYNQYKIENKYVKCLQYFIDVPEAISTFLIGQQYSAIQIVKGSVSVQARIPQFVLLNEYITNMYYDGDQFMEDTLGDSETASQKLKTLREFFPKIKSYQPSKTYIQMQFANRKQYISVHRPLQQPIGQPTLPELVDQSSQQAVAKASNSTDKQAQTDFLLHSRCQTIQLELQQANEANYTKISQLEDEIEQLKIELAASKQQQTDNQMIIDKLETELQEQKFKSQSELEIGQNMLNNFQEKEQQLKLSQQQVKEQLSQAKEQLLQYETELEKVQQQIHQYQTDTKQLKNQVVEGEKLVCKHQLMNNELQLLIQQENDKFEKNKFEYEKQIKNNEETIIQKEKQIDDQKLQIEHLKINNEVEKKVQSDNQKHDQIIQEKICFQIQQHNNELINQLKQYKDESTSQSKIILQLQNKEQHLRQHLQKFEQAHLNIQFMFQKIEQEQEDKDLQIENLKQKNEKQQKTIFQLENDTTYKKLLQQKEDEIRGLKELTDNQNRNNSILQSQLEIKQKELDQVKIDKQYELDQLQQDLQDKQDNISMLTIANNLQRQKHFDTDCEIQRLLQIIQSTNQAVKDETSYFQQQFQNQQNEIAELKSQLQKFTPRFISYNFLRNFNEIKEVQSAIDEHLQIKQVGDQFFIQNQSYNIEELKAYVKLQKVPINVQQIELVCSIPLFFKGPNVLFTLNNLEYEVICKNNKQLQKIVLAVQKILNQKSQLKTDREILLNKQMEQFNNFKECSTIPDLQSEIQNLEHKVKDNIFMHPENERVQQVKNVNKLEKQLECLNFDLENCIYDKEQHKIQKNTLSQFAQQCFIQCTQFWMEQYIENKQFNTLFISLSNISPRKTLIQTLIDLLITQFEKIDKSNTQQLNNYSQKIEFLKNVILLINSDALVYDQLCQLIHYNNLNKLPKLLSLQLTSKYHLFQQLKNLECAGHKSLEEVIETQSTLISAGALLQQAEQVKIAFQVCKEFQLYEPHILEQKVKVFKIISCCLGEIKLLQSNVDDLQNEQKQLNKFGLDIILLNQEIGDCYNITYFNSLKITPNKLTPDEEAKIAAYYYYLQALKEIHNENPWEVVIANKSPKQIFDYVQCLMKCANILSVNEECLKNLRSAHDFAIKAKCIAENEKYSQQFLEEVDMLIKDIELQISHGKE